MGSLVFARFAIPKFLMELIPALLRDIPCAGYALFFIGCGANCIVRLHVNTRKFGPTRTLASSLTSPIVIKVECPIWQGAYPSDFGSLALAHFTSIISVSRM